MYSRTYTPFLRPFKCPEIEGVYRHKESGKLMLLKGMWLRGFIECHKDKPDEPYDAYQGSINHENTGLIKKCIIEPHNLHSNYDKILDLNP
jgi:hypothetical protein